MAWPRNEALADQVVGTSFTMVPVATAKVSGAKFSLRVTPDELAAFASDLGNVNLTIIGPESGSGYSATAGAGTWSQNGSHTYRSTATIDFPTAARSRHDDTWFRAGRYRTQCFNRDGILYRTYYTVRVNAFEGGAESPAATPPPVNRHLNCNHFEAGTKFTKDTTDAQTWSSGLDVSGYIGIDLSANTGYERAAAVKFTFCATRRLCGTNGPPGAEPRRLVAVS